jgi:THO complex subunit 2
VRAACTASRSHPLPALAHCLGHVRTLAGSHTARTYHGPSALYRKEAEEAAKREVERRAAAAVRNRNQKFGVLEAAVRMGAWNVVTALFAVLSNAAPGSDRRVQNALLHLLEEMIEPIYNEHVRVPMHTVIKTKVVIELAPRQRVRQAPISVGSLDAVVDKAFPVAFLLKHHLAADVGVLTKFTRVLRVLQKRKSKDEEFNTLLEDLLAEAVLPALSLLPGNVALALEIWDVLSAFDGYVRRFRIYGRWKAVLGRDEHPDVMRAVREADVDIKKCLRRVAKENVKQFGRWLAKYAAHTPVTALGHVVRQIQVLCREYRPAIGFTDMPCVPVVSILPLPCP